MGNFRNLRAWHAAKKLAVDVDQICRRMRGARGRTLRDQLSRASVSVHDNIVEGSGHESSREFARYVRYSITSVNEVEGHLELDEALKLIEQLDASRLIADVVEIRKMLYGLLKRLDSDG
jgi:four helix bundle protein